MKYETTLKPKIIQDFADLHYPFLTIKIDNVMTLCSSLFNSFNFKEHKEMWPKVNELLNQLPHLPSKKEMSKFKSLFSQINNQIEQEPLHFAIINLPNSHSSYLNFDAYNVFRIYPECTSLEFKPVEYLATLFKHSGYCIPWQHITRAMPWKSFHLQCALPLQSRIS